MATNIMEQIEEPTGLLANAKHWAGQVVHLVKSTDDDVDPFGVLAYLDAEKGITDSLSDDELDAFLDEFSEAYNTELAGEQPEDEE